MNYRIECIPDAHLFSVTLWFEAQGFETLRMPTWTPGSYLIRAFAKNIVSLSAKCNGQARALNQIGTHEWRTTGESGGWEIRYQLFAWDSSVRTLELSRTGGFINGAALFLSVESQVAEPHHVTLQSPDTSWDCATSLAKQVCDAQGFGEYHAADYDELIDHPILMGSLYKVDFQAGGTAHQMVIAHEPELVPRLDSKRLISDLARLCSTHISFFKSPAPMHQYLFLVRLQDQGYGGLEHRSSCALVCDRRSLPTHLPLNKAQRQFMGLCSHEYFHTWWVKRVKPYPFIPYDLRQEVLTSLLWVFEGFTSYYDDLLLLRSEVITRDQYLNLLSDNLNHCLNQPGRHWQSLAQSSREAWIKLYRPDANSPNSQVSYYRQGGLLALAIDLRLRSESQCSLDQVVQELWQRYGDGRTGLDEQGENGICAHLERMSQISWQTFFEQYVEGTAPLPLAELLSRFGVRLTSTMRPLELGITSTTRGELVTVQTVYSDSLAERAGLAPQDVLLAINNERINGKNLRELLTPYLEDQEITLSFFRGDVLKHSVVSMAGGRMLDYQVELIDSGTPAQMAWLYGQ